MSNYFFRPKLRDLTKGARLEELTDLYEVSIDAIRDYDLSNPIDLIYITMCNHLVFLYSSGI